MFENCKKVVTGCDHIFNLAADMGGMGFIQSNHAVIFYNNTMVSFNVLEAARQCNCKRCGEGKGACQHGQQACGPSKPGGTPQCTVPVHPSITTAVHFTLTHAFVVQGLLRLLRMCLPRVQAAEHGGGGRWPEGGLRVASTGAYLCLVQGKMCMLERRNCLRVVLECGLCSSECVCVCGYTLCGEINEQGYILLAPTRFT